MFHEVSVEFLLTTGTDPMAELSGGMLMDIRLHFLPVSGIIADLFAPCADREKSSQGPDMGKHILELGEKLCILLLQLMFIEGDLYGDIHQMDIERFEDITKGF